MRRKIDWWQDQGYLMSCKCKRPRNHTHSRSRFHGWKPPTPFLMSFFPLLCVHKDFCLSERRVGVKPGRYTYGLLVLLTRPLRFPDFLLCGVTYGGKTSQKWSSVVSRTVPRSVVDCVLFLQDPGDFHEDDNWHRSRNKTRLITPVVSQDEPLGGYGFLLLSKGTDGTTVTGVTGKRVLTHVRTPSVSTLRTFVRGRV